MKKDSEKRAKRLCVSIPHASIRLILHCLKTTEEIEQITACLTVMRIKTCSLKCSVFMKAQTPNSSPHSGGLAVPVTPVHPVRLTNDAGSPPRGPRQMAGSSPRSPSWPRSPTLLLLHLHPNHHRLYSCDTFKSHSAKKSSPSRLSKEKIKCSDWASSG